MTDLERAAFRRGAEKEYRKAVDALNRTTERDIKLNDLRRAALPIPEGE